MKVRITLTGLLIGAAISTAQTVQPGDRSARPYPPGGRVTVELDPREAVVSLDDAIIASYLIVDGTVIAVLPSILRNRTFRRLRHTQFYQLRKSCCAWIMALTAPLSCPKPCLPEAIRSCWPKKAVKRESGTRWFRMIHW